MQRLQAFKFELLPIGKQERKMRRYAGSCRFVFNQALAWQTEQYAKDNKVKFSSNWRKVKAKVTKCHSDIANARKDYLHKTTTAITTANALVCIEDLQVRNMSKSASGTLEQKGKKVAAKSGLNKAILDQGWFEFRRQLEYKLTWRGGWLVCC